jgi:hypothetical protein
MKRFTVIGLLAAMLMFSTGFAQAADIPPSALSNQSWAVVGMGFGNATAHQRGYFFYNSTCLHTPYGGFFFNSSGETPRNRMNGTLYVVNGTGSNNTLAFLQEDFSMGAVGPKKGVAGLIKANANFTNETVTAAAGDSLYIFPASDYSLMVGIANMTINGSRGGGRVNFNGTSLLTMVQRNGASVLSTKTKGLGGVWTLVSLIADGQNKTTYRVGELTIGASATGASWTGHDGKYGDTNSSRSYAIDIDGHLFRVMNGSLTEQSWIVRNATMGVYNKTFIGYVNGSADPGLTVATKSGVVGDSSDFQNTYLKVVAAGTGRASASSAYGTGNMTTLGAGPHARGYDANTTSIDGYQLNLGTRTIGGVEFRNVTMLNADGVGAGVQFFGRWNAEKTYFVGVWNKSGSYQLLFAFPAAAASSNFTAATNTAAYWGDNASVANTFSVNGEYQGEKTYERSDLISDYGLDSSFAPVTGVKYFNASSTIVPTAKINGASNNIYFTGTYDISGLGGTLSNYRLYKLVNASSGSPTTSLSNRVFNQKSVRSPGVDGAWWLEQSGTVLPSGATLNPSVTYSLYFVIKDGGSYDLAKASTATVRVQDPQILGTITPTSSSSSSSSSGCVFNPAAGFGLEWLLLLLAPAIGIIRSRFKK